jgi:hypothetical protein
VLAQAVEVQIQRVAEARLADGARDQVEPAVRLRIVGDDLFERGAVGVDAVLLERAARQLQLGAVQAFASRFGGGDLLADFR